jgi:hypothetical protein
MQRLQSGESVKGVAKDPELGRMAMDYLSQTEKGRKILAEATPFESGKQANFKGPEGFSNVVGVGANPVMEAMAEQTELARQQLAELQKLNAKGNDTQTDFTKDSK